MTEAQPAEAGPTEGLHQRYARIQDELVLTALGQASRPARIMHLAFATGLEHVTVERSLKRLKTQGKARQSGDNWALAATTNTPKEPA